MPMAKIDMDCIKVVVQYCNDYNILYNILPKRGKILNRSNIMIKEVEKISNLLLEEHVESLNLYFNKIKLRNLDIMSRYFKQSIKYNYISVDIHDCVEEPLYTDILKNEEYEPIDFQMTKLPIEELCQCNMYTVIDGMTISQYMLDNIHLT